MQGKKTLAVAAAALLACLLAASAALAQGQARQAAARGQAHYVFRGELRAVGATSVSLTVEGGNRLALKKLLGASVEQTVAAGPRTEFLKWANGVPTVVGPGDLVAGSWVVVHVRAPLTASLAEVLATPAGVVSARSAQPTPPGKPLFLFRGKVAAAPGASSVAVDVAGGNRRALRLLLGRPASQTFAFGPETIFLRWQGKVPTVISPAQLQVGDRVVVRVRAPRGSTLEQVAATPANRVAEHERATR